MQYCRERERGAALSPCREEEEEKEKGQKRRCASSSLGGGLDGGTGLLAGSDGGIFNSFLPIEFLYLRITLGFCFLHLMLSPIFSEVIILSLPLNGCFSNKKPKNLEEE